MAPTDSAGPVGSSTPNTGSNRGDGAGRGRGKGRGKGRGQQAGARGGRSRGRGGGAGAEADAGAAQPAVVDPSAASTLPAPTIPQDAAAAAAAPDDEVEAEVCFICASPVVHQSVAPCNHRTCHICALRMRALYKNKECAHCRTAAAYVIFTDDATKRFEDYSVGAPDISSSDENIGIRYAKEDIVGDTVLLLRYNCPDNDCDFAGLSWPDLHRHVRNVHHKKMCDLCTRSKKVFTHEHELFTDKELERHMRHGDDRPGAADQTGFKGHPLCAFCGSRFYDGDKLYEHCRNKHERCFLCDREDPRQPHYYLDYNALEQHFSKDHYLCPDRECQEKKFVVFASELDLKAHQLSEHGSTLSKDVRRDARLVDMAGFDFRQPYQGDQRGGRERNGGRDRNGEREREGRGRRGRDPNAEPIPASSAQPLRRDELAFQRQMAIHSSQSVSNRTFGGQLSSTPARPTAAAPSAATNRSNANASSSTAAASTASPATGTDGRELTDPNLTTEERARLVRHASVIERASNLLQNDANKMATFRSQISAYRNDQVAPPALIESFFALFAETSSTALGTLIREVADLFEDKTKAERLRNAWNDWRAINEDYPTLPGLSGMRGAATSRGGWASATANSPAASTAPAQRQSTRVLKLKNSTQQSQRSSAQSSSWASSAGSQRSLPSATSFPALPSASGTSTPTGRASTPSSVQWTTAGGAKSQPGPSRPPTAPKSGPRPTGADNFPALPSAPKPTTTIFGYGRGAVRRDMGGSKNTGFSWGASADAESSAAGAAQEGGEEGEGKGKKKGNKGRKQVLVQWG